MAIGSDAGAALTYFRFRRMNLDIVALQFFFYDFVCVDSWDTLYLNEDGTNESR